MNRSSDFFHKLFHFEYWPAWAFYLPVYLLWPYFSWKGKSFLFFTSANPCIPHGGSFGESKSGILQILNPKFLPRTILVTSSHDIPIGLEYPIIAKPDIGERGDNISLVQTEEELKAYGKNLKRPFLIQEYLPSGFEAGVMVHRDPDTKKLEITSIAIKEFLSVTGDGVSNLGTLMLSKPRARFQWERLKKNLPMSTVLKAGEKLMLEPIGNHCRGTTFINANHLATPELVTALNEALNPGHEFYFGRFDLKADSSEEFKKGRTIKIMELNGAFSEPGHIYDPQENLLKAWRDLLQHWKILARISGKNKSRGFKTTSFSEFFYLYLDYRKLRHLSKT